MNAADAVRDLVARAISAYADDREATAALERCAARLDEPLRVAIAGMVKAGKSTLLNALLGEEIAPTDAGECTRVVTWYRWGPLPRITLVPRSGASRELPVRRDRGRLVLDLGGTPTEAVERIEIEWPTSRLRGMTLIDTPGIASLSAETSARSAVFLAPEDAPSEADAVLYLLRHLHSADLAFLRELHRGPDGGLGVIAVLSRADEVGAGRIDALVSARDIAERYRHDEGLGELALGVVPVAGLVAQTGRTLRQAEYQALAELARLGRDERERLLVSADRFTREHPQLTSSGSERRALLERFGVFGVRLACVILATGAPDAPALAERLVRFSGLDALTGLLDANLQARAEQLKARSALALVEAVLRARPRPEAADTAELVERIRANAHEFTELRLLAAARTTGLPLPAAQAQEAERILGGSGVLPAERLGLPVAAPLADVLAACSDALPAWRRRSADPLADRAVTDVCRAVVRTLEGMLVDGRSAGVLHLAAAPAG